MAEGARLVSRTNTRKLSSARLGLSNMQQYMFGKASYFKTNINACCFTAQEGRKELRLTIGKTGKVIF